MTKIPPGWSGDPKRISKLFTFGSFAAAMGFMVEVALYCERADHHPEWKNIYNKIWVELTTHDAKEVTAKDLALAAHMDGVAQKHSAKG
jgi:4a-hydroxytetrahydrobiopterin dehydratase